MSDHETNEAQKAADALFRERVQAAIDDYWEDRGAPKGMARQLTAMMVLQAQFGIKAHNWVLLGGIAALGFLALIGIIAWEWIKSIPSQLSGGS